MVARVAAVLLVLLSLSGCASGRAAEPVKTNRVEMPKSYRFAPAVIQVEAGTAVTWHNGDNFTHSVTFETGVSESLDLAPGESGTIRFDHPGEYDYICIYHGQQMKGHVTVTGP